MLVAVGCQHTPVVFPEVFCKQAVVKAAAMESSFQPHLVNV